VKFRLLYIVYAFALAGVAAAYGVVVQDFSRYEVILDRRPFGEAPSDAELAAAAAPVIPAGPSFVDSLQMCAITDGGGALRVGFLDMKTNPPKTYFLFVGESEDGIEVVSADYDAETALLRKGAEERVLAMATGMASSPQPPPRSQNTARPQTFQRMRRAREMAKRSPEEIAEARRLEIERKSPLLQGEEYEAHIREYNMNLIRMGGDMGVPLPIVLTPEEDAQLVAEGAIPPPSE
jgi:hypothetical protein